MTLILAPQILEQINSHGEASYPEEGAGFLLGDLAGEARFVRQIFVIPNAREAEARHNRYLFTPQDMLRAEQYADEQGLTLLGVFHSHPDHPDQPSLFDREWAMPWFSYLITSVQNGKAVSSRSWRLLDDRSGFAEESVEIKLAV